MAAIQADTLSLIAFEVGMFGWRALARWGFFPAGLEAGNAVFWFMMQLARLSGCLTSYSANWFLVRTGIKKRCACGGHMPG